MMRSAVISSKGRPKSRSARPTSLGSKLFIMSCLLIKSRAYEMNVQFNRKIVCKQLFLPGSTIYISPLIPVTCNDYKTALQFDSLTIPQLTILRCSTASGEYKLLLDHLNKRAGSLSDHAPFRPIKSYLSHHSGRQIQVKLIGQVNQ